MRTAVLLVALCAFILPQMTHAQFGGVEPLEFSITPEYPRPYQTVTVRPSSTLIDLSASEVVISANGAVVARGSGGAPANVTLGGPGTLTTIRVSATTGGKTYSRELSVRPADVALIVEPQTTSHPFYKGGVGVASEGQLRLVAIPDIRTSAGTRIDPANLVYTWRIGDRLLTAQSGIGKSYLSATAPVRYRDTIVTLTVATADSSVVAQTQTLVAPIDPLVRIYRNDALLGPLFDMALSGTVVMSEDEQTFRAVPYHFTTGPAITWLVNNAESGGDDDITLRASGSGGTASLVVKVKQAATYALSETKLSIKFGAERGGLGIFGL